MVKKNEKVYDGLTRYTMKELTNNRTMEKATNKKILLLLNYDDYKD